MPKGSSSKLIDEDAYIAELKARFPQISTIVGFTQTPGGGGVYTWPRQNVEISLEAVTISNMLIGAIPGDAVLTLVVTDGGAVPRYIASTHPVTGLFGSPALYGNFTFAPNNIESVRFFPGTQPFAGSYIVNVSLPTYCIVPVNGQVTVQVSLVDFSGGNGQVGTAVMIGRNSKFESAL
jgi:hypothetical protein